MPLGHTTGGPNDPETQRDILRTGLERGAAIDVGGTIVDLPWRWRDDDWKVDPLSWSRKRQDSGQTKTSGGDTRTGRSPEPRYQNDDDRLAAEARSDEEQCLVCLGIGAA